MVENIGGLVKLKKREKQVRYSVTPYMIWCEVGQNVKNNDGWVDRLLQDYYYLLSERKKCREIMCQTYKS